MTNITHYIIRDNEPFQGHCLSVLLASGKVAYSDGLTFDEFQEREGVPLRKLTEDEFFQLNDEFVASCCTDPVEITAEEYDDALNCLPPGRWSRWTGWEAFHVSERLHADLVGWYAKKGARFYSFTDRAGISEADLLAKLRKV